MILALKQKAISFKERFSVFNEDGQPVYDVEGKLISIGHKLTVSDMEGAEVAHIHQKLVSLKPKYFIEIEGREEIELKGHITLIHPHYTLETEDGDWEIKGDFMQHEYDMVCNGRTVATVTKKWLSWGDSYVIDVAEPEDAMAALCVLIAIDCVDADKHHGQSSTIAHSTH